MDISRIAKAYILAEKYGVSVDEARKVVNHTYYACGGDWTVDECWRLKGHFMDRTEMEPKESSRYANARMARQIIEMDYNSMILAPEVARIGQ
jgi:hypothetical protein